MSERYTKLFSQVKPLYAEGSPVIIMAGALLLDNVGGNVLAQLKFKNISPKTVKALTVSVTANDTVGRVIGKPTIYQYLDLNAERDAEFGQKTAISLPSENTRECEVRVLEAAFADNSVWTAPEGLSWEPVPEQTPLFPNDAELLKQYRMEVNPAAKSELLTVKDLWLCSCGAVNRAVENACHCCETPLSAMKNADLSSLRGRCDARLAKEREDAAKAAEEHRIAAEKAAKKTKKILSIAIPAAIAVIALVIVLTKVIIPGSKYNAAVELMDNGKYEEAITAFEALGDYKDSQERIKESKYQNAVLLLNEGKYHKAATEFSALKDYKDSRELSFSAWGEITERQTVVIDHNFAAAVKNDGTVVAVGYNKTGKSDVSGWTDVVAIACGDWHTVGLKSDGTVVAAGSNGDGECDVSDWTDIVAIACEYDRTVGLKSDGTVVATGDNEYGQCDVSWWTDIVAIACRGWHTVGLKSDGTVVATGSSDDYKYDQFDVSDWTDIVAVACDYGLTTGGIYSFIVGLKSDGTAVATGYNGFGQCNVSGWTDVVEIACSGSYAVGLKSDGTVVAAGNNKYGQCNVSGWTDVVEIACSGSYAVGLKSDGTVVAAGNNKYGQCNVSGWTDVVEIACSGSYTVGLKADGTVVATGDNDYGQCDVSGWTEIVAIACGDYGTFGLKSNGTVVATGRYNDDVSGWTNIKLPNNAKLKP